MKEPGCPSAKKLEFDGPGVENSGPAPEENIKLAFGSSIGDSALGGMLWGAVFEFKGVGGASLPEVLGLPAVEGEPA